MKNRKRNKTLELENEEYLIRKTIMQQVAYQINNKIIY